MLEITLATMPSVLYISIHVYIYIYVCVNVCVCENYKDRHNKDPTPSLTKIEVLNLFIPFQLAQ